MAATFPLRLSRLWNDERGLSIVEFAAVAPFLGILIVGVADLGRGYTERFAVQQAANRTLELAHSGTRKNDYSFLKAEAETAAGAGSTAVVTQWLECTNNDGTRQTKTFTSTCTSAQQTARYVTLEVSRPFVPAFTSAGYPKEADGTILLKARASLRVQ
jgi:Flp pilus assembly protein TadG